MINIIRQYEVIYYELKLDYTARILILVIHDCDRVDYL